MSIAITIFSDPQSGGEEALGRLFNALASAYDFQQKGTEVGIYFMGTGTRWASLLTQADHPAHQLFKAVESSVVGVSCGCADVFGATEEATEKGFDLITDNAVPGTTGLPSLADLSQQGHTILSF